jgi:hypothetical protein
MVTKWAWVIGFCTGVVGCVRHAEPPPHPSEVELGRCKRGVDRRRLCGNWSEATTRCEGDGDVHTSFPELEPAACFVRVRYQDGRLPRPDPSPEGCGYPQDDSVAAKVEREARRHERFARGETRALPMALDCELPVEVRSAAARANGRALRRLHQRLRRGERFPYGAVATFGFGHPAQRFSELVAWRPDDSCRSLDKWQMDLFSLNRERAARAAAAYHGGVGPLVIVSGGAVHSPLYEAFMLQHLVSCTFGVPRDAVLLDPCADHTHTNVRNSGGLVRLIGARTAYVVTSDDFQAGYLQEWTLFNAIGGSIDQRALRDWGYLLGSWRQASMGIDAGFWFTPYRFWGEPRATLGGLSCSR